MRKIWLLKAQMMPPQNFISCIYFTVLSSHNIELAEILQENYFYIIEDSKVESIYFRKEQDMN